MVTKSILKHNQELLDFKKNYVGKWLDSRWKVVGLRSGMVGFTLENGWIKVRNGWIYVGKWLDLRWKMVGLTLESGWINVGKWSDHDVV